MCLAASVNMLSSPSKKTLSLILINLDLAAALTAVLRVKSVHIGEALRTIVWHREKFSKCQVILTRLLKLL